ncbi:hypothetical protein CC80DRAFT_241967 [Byssothecium circinans]|uniref:Uncharacterized protein n=1 Tax=Byssothecium circinans TaxID=147558 RepID=A0A6A5TBP2_9PLEO|nr:hypothetical protein CC80DRAFT_241967 [Byssothecium circinans]
MICTPSCDIRVSPVGFLTVHQGQFSHDPGVLPRDLLAFHLIPWHLFSISLFSFSFK